MKVKDITQESIVNDGYSFFDPVEKSQTTQSTISFDNSGKAVIKPKKKKKRQKPV